MVFLKSCFLNVRAAATLKKHLRNLKRITNVNVTCANHLKRRAKLNKEVDERSVNFYEREIGTFLVCYLKSMKATAFMLLLKFYNLIFIANCR